MFNVEEIDAGKHFVRKDYPTIMSGWVVRYRLRSRRFDGEINASRDGWSVTGIWPIMDFDILEEFLFTVRKAYFIYRGLNGRGAKNPLPEETVVKLTREYVPETAVPGEETA